MKLKTLIQNTNRLEIAEVEIEFIPGIPQIHFLGLPDRIIKESFYRIKSALKSSGYKFPLTSQMIVNIKPSHLRKSSRGLELAVALGILIKTGQIAEDVINTDWVIYGELGLDGKIYEPSDLQINLLNLSQTPILTGHGDFPSCYRLKSLQDIAVEFTEKKIKYHRPTRGMELSYSKEEAEFLFLAAASGIHSLLAGDSGAGKSTLAHAVLSFLSEPSVEECVRLENLWRPLVSPHQSITPAAFLGGGANLYEGEIERAQGGILLLDEFLEFDAEILESLRGPMTGEKLRLSRASSQREYSSKFQVIATSNLCICGKWTPLKKNISCRYTRRRCSLYLEKLSGPVLDRFGLLFYIETNPKRIITGQEILVRIQKYYAATKKIVSTGPVPKILESYYENLSTRRKNYLNKIACIFAIERFAQVASETKTLELDVEDYNRAERWVIKPFELLEKGMG